MKTIFFDCKNGISGDMVLKALMDLSRQREAIEEALKTPVQIRKDSKRWQEQQVTR